jgi:competence protein ComEC
MEILCFLAGIVFAYTHSLFPLLFVVVAIYLKAPWRVILWFLIAVLWALLHQVWTSDRAMPNQAVIASANLLGEVSSIPIVSAGKVQFEFRVSQLNEKSVSARVMLSCYQHCPTFQLNQVWRLQAKLKRPKNLGNPGHFDYQRMMLARHIQWTGYLKGRKSELLMTPDTSFGITSLRARLADNLKQAIPNQDALGIVQALTLGLTSNISQSLWELFRRTGTTHLMVISGAHISLVAGLAYCLAYWLWLLAPRLCLYRPALQSAAIAGIVFALGYALLAGLSIPSQRAVISFCLLLLRHFGSVRLTGWQAWRYALLLVLIFEPHAVLLSGFSLSFLAVAILIACGQRFPFGGIQKTAIVQLTCLLGLMPATLFWFSYGAVDGLFANLIAIPLVGYFIVPLALITLLCLSIHPVNWLIFPIDWAIKLLLSILAWVDKLSSLNLDFTLANVWSLMALMLSGMIVMFLPLRKLRLAALALFLGALYPSYPRHKLGDAQVSVLDVGQGLAVVVTTAHHSLIYDTGMKFYRGGDMAKMAIIPYLASQGIKTIDKVVISHPDLDHRGGLLSLESHYPVGELIVDNVNFYHRGFNCHQYPAWQWDGVTFQFFPIKQAFRDKNNSSCVLRISNAAGSVLLPGDIESSAEYYLATTYAHNLASDVLIVPHHGSKTSSTQEFIQQVAPRFAVISAGFDNRYHFPHQQTLNTMKQQKTRVFNTITCGMVTIKLELGKPGQEPTCFD